MNMNTAKVRGVGGLPEYPMHAAWSSRYRPGSREIPVGRAHVICATWRTELWRMASVATAFLAPDAAGNRPSRQGSVGRAIVGARIAFYRRGTFAAGVSPESLQGGGGPRGARRPGPDTHDLSSQPARARASGRRFADLLRTRAVRWIDRELVDASGGRHERIGNHGEPESRQGS